MTQSQGCACFTAIQIVKKDAVDIRLHIRLEISSREGAKARKRQCTSMNPSRLRVRTFPQWKVHTDVERSALPAAHSFALTSDSRHQKLPGKLSGRRRGLWRGWLPGCIEANPGVLDAGTGR